MIQTPLYQNIFASTSTLLHLFVLHIHESSQICYSTWSIPSRVPCSALETVNPILPAPNVNISFFKDFTVLVQHKYNIDAPISELLSTKSINNRSFSRYVGGHGTQSRERCY